jgi:hypothetical protein
MAVGLWIFRPSPSFNEKNLAAELLALKEPLSDVRINYYLDGGSFGIDLVGCDGAEVKCELPVSDRSPESWDRVRITSGNSAAKELSSPWDNKAYLIRLIERHAPRGEDKINALVRLRGIERDHISAWLYSLQIGFSPTP